MGPLRTCPATPPLRATRTRPPPAGPRAACSSARPRPSSCPLEGCQVARDRLHGAAVLLRGAELHEVGAGVDHRHVSRRGVVGVTRLVDLLAVRVAERQAALDDVPPVGALAAVVGEPFEQWRGVSLVAEGLEPDGVAPELLIA